MIESLWIPGLAVLAVGLAVGVWAARRLPGSPRATRDSAADLELAIADLETRRDQIYAQLRGVAGEALGESDRRQLELSAARTLKELDQRLAQRGDRPPRRDATAGQPPPVTAEPPVPNAGLAARHPLVAGFLLGAGMVAVIGVLIYWAVRDARPREEPMAATPPPVRGAVSPDDAHAGIDDLPITLAVELDALNQRVANDDGTFSARRERALFYLGIERYVEAFEDAEFLLAADPQDIDGLYVQGVVRLTMGQDEIALGLFDEVVRLFPNHVQALVWRGIVLFRMGDREGAIAGWRRALDASGGSQPDIERLIESALQAPEPPPPAAAGADTAGATADAGPAAAPPPRAPAPDDYAVRISLAPGAAPPPGGILFVSLRGPEGGPPIAVKRVARVSGFPLDLTLGAADSMMGQALPASGTLRVRLDADGSASTRSPEDLEAEAEATPGRVVSLVLGAG